MKQIRSTKGQIVPLILLIILVGATIGFSIAGTAIRNIQQTALTEESERAYTAAEAGLEQVLLELETNGTATAISNVGLPSGAKIKSVDVTQIKSLNIANLPKDEVAQINLSCPSSDPSCVTTGGPQLRLLWDKTASLVITKIGTGAPYTVTRWAVYCGADNLDNFDLATALVATNQCEKVIDFDPNVDLVLRIRTMYAATSLTAETNIAGSLPVQSTRLTSTGQSGEAERTVQVERSAPVPPAILDYVLFSSQGSLTK